MKEFFSEPLIESFIFPHHLKQICEGAFDGYLYLNKIEIPSDLEIELIGQWSPDVSIISIINVCSNNPYFIIYNDKIVLKKSSIYCRKF